MAQRAVEARDLARRIQKSLALGEFHPPRKVERTFRSVQRKLTLGRGAVPYSLLSAVELLCIYDRYERTIETAELLGEIDPLRWDIDYSYVQMAIHLSYFFASRAGDDKVARLEPIIALPPGYRPAPLMMNGTRLNLPFARDTHPDYLGDVEANIANEAMVDIMRFATMWTFGGSPEWSRSRIETATDATINGLRGLKGYEPW